MMIAQAAVQRKPIPIRRASATAGPSGANIIGLRFGFESVPPSFVLLVARSVATCVGSPKLL